MQVLYYSLRNDQLMGRESGECALTTEDSILLLLKTSTLYQTSETSFINFLERLSFLQLICDMLIIMLVFAQRTRIKLHLSRIMVFGNGQGKHLDLLTLPAFQRAMNNIFQDLDYVLVYLDDILLLSKTHEEHMKHIGVVMQRLFNYNLKIRMDKCKFFADEL